MSNKIITVDSTIEDQNLNNYDLLRIAFNNNWISENELILMTELDAIFSSSDLEDYFDNLEHIIMRDEMDVDPQFVNTDLTSLFMENSIKYLKNLGLILDEEEASNIGLYRLSIIVRAINLLNSVPEDLVITIMGILQEREEYGNLETLYNLLNTIEPAVTTELFFKIVKDVYPNFFTILENAVKEIIKRMNLEGNEDTMDVGNRRIGDIVQRILNVLSTHTKDKKIFPGDENKFKLYENIYTILMLPDDFFRALLDTNQDFFALEYKEKIKELNIVLEKYKDKDPIEKLYVLFYNLSALITLSLADRILNNDFDKQTIKNKIMSDGIKIFNTLELNNIDKIISIYVNEILDILEEAGYTEYLLNRFKTLRGADNERQ